MGVSYFAPYIPSPEGRGFTARADNTAHYRDPTAWRAIKRLERWQKKNALESSVRRSDVQDDKSYAKDTKRQEGEFTGE